MANFRKSFFASRKSDANVRSVGSIATSDGIFTLSFNKMLLLSLISLGSTRECKRGRRRKNSRWSDKKRAASATRLRTFVCSKFSGVIEMRAARVFFVCYLKQASEPPRSRSRIEAVRRLEIQSAALGCSRVCRRSLSAACEAANAQAASAKLRPPLEQPTTVAVPGAAVFRFECCKLRVSTKRSLFEPQRSCSTMLDAAFFARAASNANFVRCGTLLKRDKAFEHRLSRASSPAAFLNCSPLIWRLSRVLCIAAT